MFLIGIILLVLGGASAAAAFVAARADSTTTQLSAFGFTRDAPPLEILIVGAASVLVFCIGWALLASALRRRARVRREDREHERIAEAAREAEAQRVEHERQIEAQRVEYQNHLDDAGLRNEDLSRREQELAEQRRDLDAREQELARLEEAYRAKVEPSVADVVTGRAHGRVSDGTAEWTDPANPEATSPRRPTSTDPANPEPTSPRRPTRTERTESTDSAESTDSTDGGPAHR